MTDWAARLSPLGYHVFPAKRGKVQVTLVGGSTIDEEGFVDGETAVVSDPNDPTGAREMELSLGDAVYLSSCNSRRGSRCAWLSSSRTWHGSRHDGRRASGGRCGSRCDGRHNSNSRRTKEEAWQP